MSTTLAMPAAHIGEGRPCPRCLSLALAGETQPWMVLPLHPEKARRPQARDGSGPCCDDCASADTIMRFVGGMDFTMARIAIGNDRDDQLRLPGAPMGLYIDGLMKPSAPGDFERHLTWLKEQDLWPAPEDDGEEHT